MSIEREWCEQARVRLKQKASRKHRVGSVSSSVEQLMPEIHEARARGKSWNQIARDIAGNEALKPDAVRLAYRRLQKADQGAAHDEPKHKSRGLNSGLRPAECVAVEVTDNPAIAIDAGLFAPMFDARDTQGRSHGEERS